MRCRVGLASAVILAVLPLVAIGSPPALASGEIEISGVLRPSSSLASRAIRFCPAGDDTTCKWAERSNDAFAVTLVPGDYEVTVQLDHGYRNYSYLRQTMTLSASDEWQLELPELVTIDVSAVDDRGEPYPFAIADERGPKRIDDLKLSPDLPAFEGKAYYPKVRTDAAGKASLQVIPDDHLTLPVGKRVDGVDLRFPLNTPSRSWVDASQDVSVVAQALPMHSIKLALKTADGEQLWPNIELRGKWAHSWGGVLAEDSILLRVPEGRSTIRLSSEYGASVGLPPEWQVDQPLRVEADKSITLTLPQVVRVDGTVVDGNDSRPESGVVVSTEGNDPADAAVLADGLKPALIRNGRLWSWGQSSQRQTSDTNGGVQFVLFPDSDLQLGTLLRETGVLREAADLRIDASTDTSFTRRLPRSVTLAATFTDHAGDPTAGNEIRLRQYPLSSGYTWAQFADAGQGHLTMEMNPGPWLIDVRLGPTQLELTRELEVFEDTELSFQAPPSSQVRLITLVDGATNVMSLELTGDASVLTDAGPVDAGLNGSARISGSGIVEVASVADVTISGSLQTYEYGYDASVAHVDLTSDRTVVLVSGEHYVGAGAPYVEFEEAGELVLSGHSSVSWNEIEMTGGSWTRTASTPFGKKEIQTLGDQTSKSPYRVYYEEGATTCLHAVPTRGDITGPAARSSCRTRPYDDRTLFGSEGWQRVDDADAYSGSFRRATDRGSRLGIGPLSWVHTSPLLLADTGPNAGTVRLRIGGEWASDPISLAITATRTTNVVALPLNWYTPRDGKLQVVVVSDGKPVRIDGLAIPGPTY